MGDETVFKVCPMCSTTWETRDDFLRDTSLFINGYDVDFEELDYSLFYFTHMVDGCHSTLGIQAREFLDLYSGEKFKGRRTGMDDCPGYCLQQDQLDRCDALCECAFNREIIQFINKLRKN